MSSLPVNQTATSVIIPSIPGQSIVVQGLALIASAAVTITIESTTGPVVLAGPFELLANSLFVLPVISGPSTYMNQFDQPVTSPPVGWVTSSSGDSITLLQSGAATVSGVIVFSG
jgi:hypothetical protein